MKKKSDAKRKAVKGLKSEMRQDLMSSLPEKMKGKMAVKVSADSPEELKAGLEKAEELMEMGEKGEGDLGELLKGAFAKRMKKPKKEEE